MRTEASEGGAAVTGSRDLVLLLLLLPLVLPLPTAPGWVHSSPSPLERFELLSTSAWTEWKACRPSVSSATLL